MAFAVNKGHMDVVKALLEAGASVKKANIGVGLINLIFSRNREIIKLLRKYSDK